MAINSITFGGGATLTTASASINLSIGSQPSTTAILVYCVSDNGSTTSAVGVGPTISSAQGVWERIFWDINSDGIANDGTSVAVFLCRNASGFTSLDPTITFNLGSNPLDSHAGFLRIDSDVPSIYYHGFSVTKSASGTSLSATISNLFPKIYGYVSILGAEGEDTAKTPAVGWTELVDGVTDTAGAATANMQYHVQSRIETVNTTGITATSSAVTFTNGIQVVFAFSESLSPIQVDPLTLEDVMPDATVRTSQIGNVSSGNLINLTEAVSPYPIAVGNIFRASGGRILVTGDWDTWVSAQEPSSIATRVQHYTSVLGAGYSLAGYVVGSDGSDRDVRWGINNAGTILAEFLEDVIPTNVALKAFNANTGATILNLLDRTSDNSIGRAIKPLDDGTFIACIQSNTVWNGTAVGPLFAISADGLSVVSGYSWQTIDASKVSQIEIQSDGKILVYCGFGTITAYGGNTFSACNLIRLNSDGSFDSTFNRVTLTGQTVLTARNILKTSLVMLSGGGFALCGDFTAVNGNTFYAEFAIFNSDGSLNTSFPTGLLGITGLVATLAEHPNGGFIIGGNFTSSINSKVNGIGYVKSDCTWDTAFQSLVGPIKTSPTKGEIYAIAVDGNFAMIGGDFFSYEGVSVAHLVAIDLSEFNPNATILATPLTLEDVMPDATVVAIRNVAVTVSPLTALLSIQNATIALSRTVFATALTASLAINNVSVAQGIGDSVTTDSSSVIVTLEAVTVLAVDNVSVSVNQLSGSLAINNPTVLLSVAVSATPLTLSATLQNATALISSSVSFLANQLTLSATLQNATVVQGLGDLVAVNSLGLVANVESVNVATVRVALVTATPLTVAVVVNNAVISAGTGDLVVVDPITSAFVVQNVTVFVVKNNTFSAQVLSSAFSLQQPAVQLGQGVSVSATVLTLTASLQNVSVSTANSFSVTPITLSASLQAVTVFTAKSHIVAPDHFQMTVFSGDVSVVTTKSVNYQASPLALSVTVENASVLTAGNDIVPVDHLTLTYQAGIVSVFTQKNLSVTPQSLAVVSETQLPDIFEGIGDLIQVAQLQTTIQIGGVSVIGKASVSANLLSYSASVLNATTTSPIIVQPSTIQLAYGQIGQVVVIGQKNVSVSASVLSISSFVDSPNIIAGFAVSVSAQPLQVSTDMPQVSVRYGVSFSVDQLAYVVDIKTVSASVNESIQADLIELSYSLLSVSIETSDGVFVTPSPIESLFEMNTAIVDFGEVVQVGTLQSIYSILPVLVRRKYTDLGLYKSAIRNINETSEIKDINYNSRIPFEIRNK